MIRMNFGSTWPSTSVLKEIKMLRIFPNPAKKTLNIESFNELENDTKIELMILQENLVL